MWVKQETRIRFEYPDEYEYEQEYIKEHDMSKWKNFQDTLGSTYVFTSSFNVDVTGGKTDD